MRLCVPITALHVIKNLASLIFQHPFAQMGQIASIFSKGIPSYYKIVVYFWHHAVLLKRDSLYKPVHEDIGKVNTVERSNRQKLTDFFPAVTKCRYTGAPGISLGWYQLIVSWKHSAEPDNTATNMSKVCQGGE